MGSDVKPGKKEAKELVGERRMEVIGSVDKEKEEMVGVLSDATKSSSDGLWWTIFGSILLATFWTRLHKVRISGNGIFYRFCYLKSIVS
jgi:hypothetical protein